jgi:hypothetical protein
VTRRAAAVGACICFAAAVALHAAEDRVASPLAVDEPTLLYVRSPAVAKRLALDYRAVVADMYWIRALQHFGRERLSPPTHVRTFALLYPLLDLTTTLDPYFNIAYRFGSIFVGEPYPGGPGRPDLAIALLRKGLAYQPSKWQYMQDLGFVYYWHLNDYRAAAAWFQRASEVPGAPSWLRPLAAVTLAEGGHTSASRLLWQQIAQSDEQWLRDQARRRLTQLDVMDEIARLEPAIERFRREHPGAPTTWPTLVAAGVVRSIPRDAAGTPLVIDPASGRVEVARDSPLWPMPGQNPEGGR